MREWMPFWSGPTWIFERLWGGSPEATEQIIGLILGEVNPLAFAQPERARNITDWGSVDSIARNLTTMLAPPGIAIQQAHDVYKNKNHFTGQAIAPDHVTRKQKSQQFDNNTSEVAKVVSPLIGGLLTPMELDYLTNLPWVEDSISTVDLITKANGAGVKPYVYVHAEDAFSAIKEMSDLDYVGTEVKAYAERYSREYIAVEDRPEFWSALDYLEKMDAGGKVTELPFIDMVAGRYGRAGQSSALKYTLKERALMEIDIDINAQREIGKSISKHFRNRDELKWHREMQVRETNNYAQWVRDTRNDDKLFFAVLADALLENQGLTPNTTYDVKFTDEGNFEELLYNWNTLITTFAPDDPALKDEVNMFAYKQIRPEFKPGTEEQDFLTWHRRREAFIVEVAETQGKAAAQRLVKLADSYNTPMERKYETDLRMYIIPIFKEAEQTVYNNPSVMQQPGMLENHSRLRNMGAGQRNQEIARDTVASKHYQRVEQIIDKIVIQLRSQRPTADSMFILYGLSTEPYTTNTSQGLDSSKRNGMSTWNWMQDPSKVKAQSEYPHTPTWNSQTDEEDTTYAEKVRGMRLYEKSGVSDDMPTIKEQLGIP